MSHRVIQKNVASFFRHSVCRRTRELWLRAADCDKVRGNQK